MSGVVLDASAILAVLFGEAGDDVVVQAAEAAQVSTVNFAEVVTKLIDRPYTPEETRALLETFAFQIIPFEEGLSFRAGLLRRETRALGLSLGDRACLALAMRERLPVFTADRRWAELDLDIEINVIR